MGWECQIDGTSDTQRPQPERHKAWLITKKDQENCYRKHNQRHTGRHWVVESEARAASIWFNSAAAVFLVDSETSVGLNFLDFTVG